MTTLITVIILLACLVLAFFVLIQAPKGGGLNGNFGSMSTAVMGVKQSADVMEKGTWTTMAVIALLCIFSVRFAPKAPKAPKATTQQQSGAPGAQGAAPAGNAPAAPAR